MVQYVNKHACNSLRRTFSIVPDCPTGHDNEKLCTLKYMNMYKNSLEFWKLCHFVFVSLVQCQPKQEETASKSLPSGLQYKVKRSNRSISRVLKFRDFPSSYQLTQILFDKRSSNGKMPF